MDTVSMDTVLYSRSSTVLYSRSSSQAAWVESATLFSGCPLAVSSLAHYRNVKSRKRATYSRDPKGDGVSPSVVLRLSNCLQSWMLRSYVRASPSGAQAQRNLICYCPPSPNTRLPSPTTHLLAPPNPAPCNGP